LDVQAPVDIQIPPALGLAGRVLDDMNAPLSAVLVTVFSMDKDADSQSSVTADDGSFKIDDVPIEPPKVVLLRRARFATSAFRIPTAQSGSREQQLGDMRMTTNVASLQGVIMNQDNNPVEGVVVALKGMNDNYADMLPPESRRSDSLLLSDLGLGRYVGQHTMTTKAGGRFMFADLAAGSYKVSVQTTASQYLAETSIVLVAGQHRSDMAIAIQTSGTLVGRVITVDGQACPDVLLHIEPQQQAVHSDVFVRTDGQGRFECAFLPCAVVRLTARPPRSNDFAAPQLAANILDEVAVNRTVEIVLSPASRIEGFVFDSSGQPSRGAFVTANSTQGMRLDETFADSLGRFILYVPDSESVMISGFSSTLTSNRYEPNFELKPSKSGPFVGSQSSIRLQLRTD
jgi:hypothetical protein